MPVTGPRHPVTFGSGGGDLLIAPSELMFGVKTLNLSFRFAENNHDLELMAENRTEQPSL